MKMKRSSLWMYTAMVAVVIFMASCGNSQKKKERAAERQMAGQPMDSVTVIESETVVLFDSLAPDSVVTQKNVNTPKKTK